MADHKPTVVSFPPKNLEVLLRRLAREIDSEMVALGNAQKQDDAGGPEKDNSKLVFDLLNNFVAQIKSGSLRPDALLMVVRSTGSPGYEYDLQVMAAGLGGRLEILGALTDATHMILTAEN